MSLRIGAAFVIRKAEMPDTYRCLKKSTEIRKKETSKFKFSKITMFGKKIRYQYDIEKFAHQKKYYGNKRFAEMYLKI